jgi:hypothetical protein
MAQIKHDPEKQHHVWCNFFMRPREGCWMCEELYKKYPMNGLTPDELMAKHFPNNVKVGPGVTPNLAQTEKKRN